MSAILVAELYQQNGRKSRSLILPVWAVHPAGAMRVGGVETNSDVDDIKLLARAIGLKSSEEALKLVEKFYPQNMLQPKTRLGLEEIFANLDGVDDDPSSSAP